MPQCKVLEANYDLLLFFMRRLDEIMARKGKGLAWPESDSEFSDLSIHSSELSDLDSDVHSLSSLMSCANSWIEDAKYPTPAENTLKCLAFAAGVRACNSASQEPPA